MPSKRGPEQLKKKNSREMLCKEIYNLPRNFCFKDKSSVSITVTKKNSFKYFLKIRLEIKLTDLRPNRKFYSIHTGTFMADKLTTYL